MRLLSHLLALLEPAELEDLKTDELLSALIDPTVRKHWLFSVMEEIKGIHTRTHAALMSGQLVERFAQESAKLQGIVFVLRQILLSKNSVQLDKRHNPAGSDPDVAVQPL